MKAPWNWPFEIGLDDEPEDNEPNEPNEPNMRDDPDDYEAPGEWLVFTRQVNDPKLAALEADLAKAGVPSRRRGVSKYGAPMLEIRRADISAAWRVLPGGLTSE